MKAVHELADAGRPASHRLIREQAAREGAFDPVAQLAHRTAGVEEEPLLVTVRGAANGLCDVRPDGVGGADQLHTDCPLIEARPVPNSGAQFVGEGNGLLVRDQVLVPSHAMEMREAPEFHPRMTNDERRTTGSAATQ